MRVELEPHFLDVSAAQRTNPRQRATASQLALRYAPLALCAAILVWHALRYRFVTDDAFISFVFSRNFAEHGALVFNPGMPAVEGYTNFLWTFLLGLLMVVGLQPEITSQVLGAMFAIGTLVVVFRLSEHVFGRPSKWDVLAPALLSLTAGVACWTSGGLETQMFTFWVVLAIWFYARSDHRTTGDAASTASGTAADHDDGDGDGDGDGGDRRALRWMGLVLALAAMTRPEGLLVAAVLGGHRLAIMILRDRRRRPRRDELMCLLWFLALWTPWFAWRAWYYGHLFPNTYYVKAAGPAAAGYHDQLREVGLYYVWQFGKQTGLVYAAPLLLLGFLVARVRSRRFYLGSLAVLLSLVYLVYAVRVGGDFMGLHRFVMPLFPLGALGVVFGGRWLCDRLPSGTVRAAVAVAAALGLIAVHGYRQLTLTDESLRFGNFANDHGIDTPAYLRVYAHDRGVIGKHMRECFRDDDFAIYGGAGAKPYYAHLRGIDVFGLVSERIAHEVPRTRPRPGHNKWAPDSLLREFEPDFVFSCYGIHPDPKRPRWNCSPGAWHRHGYRPMTIHIPGILHGGEYYSFLIANERAETFSCPGLVE